MRQRAMRVLIAALLAWPAAAGIAGCTGFATDAAECYEHHDCEKKHGPGFCCVNGACEYTGESCYGDADTDTDTDADTDADTDTDTDTDTRPSCLIDDMCPSGQVCSERRCVTTDDRPDGDFCFHWTQCHSGLCEEGRCRPACRQNADCPPGLLCAETGNGLLACLADTRCTDCDGVADYCAGDRSCRSRNCRVCADCPDGDCVIPTASPVQGTCSDQASCAADEFRTGVGDATYCMTYQACTTDADCGPYHSCALEAELPFCTRESGLDQLPLVALPRIASPTPEAIKPLDTVTFDGSQSHSAAGKTISYRWYFNQAPADSHTSFSPESNPGAASTLESESTSAQPTLFMDLAGTYRACLEICEEGGGCTSDTGSTGDACLDILSLPREQLHVQLVWDHPETDLDLHYIGGGLYGDRTDTSSGDCHFFNLHPDYCTPGDESDDPSLDIDDVRGYGPENVNHNNVCNGEYRIWVTYYEDKGMGSTRAKVRVFVRGVMIAEASQELTSRNCHWLVGKVEWTDGAALWIPAVSGNYVCGTDNPEGG